MPNIVPEAQELLAVTLARAQSEEDREMLTTVRELGGQVVHLLNGLLRMAHMHAPNNQAFDAPVRELSIALKRLTEILGPVYVLCAEDQVYVNEVRIRSEFAVDDKGALVDELGRHHTGGLTFNEPLSGDEVRKLAWLLADKAAAEKPRHTLQRRLNEAGLESVVMHPLFRFRMTGVEDERMSTEFRELYLESASVVAETFVNLGASRLPNPLPVRRLLNQMIDAGEGHDVAAMAFSNEAQLPVFARHTLMVTTLSVQIGRAAGLPDSSLSDLGVAAMFHDVGFSLKEGGYTTSFPSHTQTGINILLRQRGFHKAKIRRLLTVLQHHREVDDPRGAPHLFARIVHIADDYDILTRFRPGRGPATSPPDALARMAGGAGKAYDPLLLQLFINIMGPLPPGSILQLTDGFVVVVVSTVRSPETFDKPLAKVLRMADGSRPPGDVYLELKDAAPIKGILRPTG